MAEPTPHHTTAQAARTYFVTAQNCEGIIGVPWRWLIAHAPELGIEIHRVGRKAFVRLADAISAIESRSARSADDIPVDPAETIRSALGLRLRGSR